MGQGPASPPHPPSPSAPPLSYVPPLADYPESYFRDRKRSDQRIAVAIIVFLVVIVVAPVAYFVVQADTAPTLSSSLTLGPAQVGSGPHPTVWFENMSVEGASHGLLVVYLDFQVLNRTRGEGVPIPAGSTLVVLVGPYERVASFGLSSHVWSTTDPDALVSTDQTFQLEWNSTSPSDPLVGDSLQVFSGNDFSGSLYIVMA